MVTPLLEHCERRVFGQHLIGRASIERCCKDNTSNIHTTGPSGGSLPRGRESSTFQGSAGHCVPYVSATDGVALLGVGSPVDKPVLGATPYQRT